MSLKGGSVNISSGARIVNFPAEMFNDAFFFLEEAKKLDKQATNDWLCWRYLRASIIYSLTSLEAYTNRFIASIISDKLKLPNIANDFDDERMYSATKFEIILPLLTGKEIDKTRQEWANFKAMNKTRNRIVHYLGGTEIYNDADIEGVNIVNA